MPAKGRKVIEVRNDGGQIRHVASRNRRSDGMTAVGRIHQVVGNSQKVRETVRDRKFRHRSESGVV